MIEIVPYQANWTEEFVSLGRQIREVLGDRALAIHHIGSTSVPELCAKDVIDVQISVGALEPSILEDLSVSGFVRSRVASDHCPPGMSLPEEDLAKMMCGGPGRKAHIHVRVFGRFNQRYPLLCRDYLRSHRSAAEAYGKIKQELSRYFPDNVEAYYDIKDPVFDVLMAGAADWAQQIRWVQPSSDA
jgi:GrpB-like predicted nucleotidyltransferase (UPF0157 family)